MRKSRNKINKQQSLKADKNNIKAQGQHWVVNVNDGIFNFTKSGWDTSYLVNRKRLLADKKFKMEPY